MSRYDPRFGNASSAGAGAGAGARDGERQGGVGASPEDDSQTQQSQTHWDNMSNVSLNSTLPGVRNGGPAYGGYGGGGQGGGRRNPNTHSNPWTQRPQRTNALGESEEDSVREANYAMSDFPQSQAPQGQGGRHARFEDDADPTDTTTTPAPVYSAAPAGLRTWYDAELDQGDTSIPGYSTNPPSRRNTIAQPGEAGIGETYYQSDVGRLPQQDFGGAGFIGGYGNLDVTYPQPTYHATVSNAGDLSQVGVGGGGGVGGFDNGGSRITYRSDGKGICTPLCLRHDPTSNTEEKAFFFYNPDSTRYDLQVQVRVYYTRNTRVKDCLENRLLKLERHKTVSERLETIGRGILRYVRMMNEFYFPATEVRLVTQESGEITFDAGEDYEVMPDHALPIFPELPDTPELERVTKAPLGALTKLATLKYEVDLVTWTEDPQGPPHEYAFKRTMTSSTILTELQALLALKNCPHVPNLSAIVVDTPRVGSTRIRGFLIPYCPAGDLGDLLARYAAASRPGATMTAISRSPPPLSWGTKLSWMHSLAKTIQTAHAKGIVHGDLKPDNVLLFSSSLDGQSQSQSLKLIDFAPVGPERLWGAPEYKLDWYAYLNHALQLTKQHEAIPEYDFRRNMDPELDVWGLGALMWAIGEEQPGTGEEGFCDLKNRKWEKSPKWYRDLAESCLRKDPKSRPSVSSVLLKIASKKPALFFA